MENNRTSSSVAELTRDILAVEAEHISRQRPAPAPAPPVVGELPLAEPPSFLSQLRSTRPRRPGRQPAIRLPDLRRTEGRYQAYLEAALEALPKAIEEHVLPLYEGWVASATARLPEVREDAHVSKPGSRGGHIIGYHNGEPVYGKPGQVLKRTKQSNPIALEFSDSELHKMAPKWGEFEKTGNWVFPKKSVAFAQEALDDWMQPEGYSRINRTLRSSKGQDWKTGSLQRTIRYLQSTIEHAGTKLSRDVTVYRAVGKMGFTLAPGVEFTDRGFAATTASKRFGEDIRKEIKGTLLRIKIPSGTNVIAPEGKFGAKEVLLGRGTKFRIIGKTGNVFEAEVVR